MKKILLCCVVVVLTMIICVLPSFATQGSFEIDFDTLTSLYDVQVEPDYGDFNCVVRYYLEIPFDDSVNGVSFDSVVISYTALDSLGAIFYNGSQEVVFVDTPDITAYAGNVTYIVESSSVSDISRDDVMTLFGSVFTDVSLSVPTYSPLVSIFTAFSFVFAWLPASVVTLISIFWTGSALTPIGVLSVAGLSIGVILLIFSIISRFLKFRG